ncbi:MAG: glucose 1-dehydrogenase [bacterium]
MAKKLEGKVAIVTGSTRGIGEAIARLFAEEGAKVVVSSRKEDAVEKTVAALKEAGGDVLGVPCHTGKADQVKNLVAKTVEHFGGIDILVNNAATNPAFCPIQSVSEGVFDKLYEVNVKGYFLLTVEAGKHFLKKKSGVVVNLASIAGFTPDLGLGAYSVTKAAVIMLSKVFAREWSPYNIRVNTVAPGLVKTKFSQALWGNEDILKVVLQRTPMGRTGEPDEIAKAALFLASDDSSYVTGHTLVVDGGAIA